MRLDPETEYEVDCRCPDCGPVSAELLSSDRDGPTEARCPGCRAVLYFAGKVGRDKVRVKAAAPDLAGGGPNPRNVIRDLMKDFNG